MCPNGCCSNNLKEVAKITSIRSTPNKNAEIIATLKPGNIVECLIGEMHLKPCRFIVKKPFGKYHPKDIIWVYQYLEEGTFTVWFNGQMYEEDLGFSPDDPSAGKRCELSDLCLGELDKELESTLWVKVKGQKGSMGWTDEPYNFSKINNDKQ